MHDRRSDFSGNTLPILANYIRPAPWSRRKAGKGRVGANARRCGSGGSTERRPKCWSRRFERGTWTCPAALRQTWPVAIRWRSSGHDFGIRLFRTCSTNSETPYETTHESFLTWAKSQSLRTGEGIFDSRIFSEKNLAENFHKIFCSDLAWIWPGIGGLACVLSAGYTFGPIISHLKHLIGRPTLSLCVLYDFMPARPTFATSLYFTFGVWFLGLFVLLRPCYSVPFFIFQLFISRM